jgi:phage tail tape-measure protein
LYQALSNFNKSTGTGQARLGYFDPTQRYNWARTFHFDAPHPGAPSYHFNAEAGPFKRFNHGAIPEWLYPLGSTRNLGRIAAGAAVVGIGLDVYNIATAGRKEQPGAILGAAGGIGGAFVGEAVGTIILPGVGTAIGGLIGGSIGGGLGQFGGDWISSQVY